MTYGTTTYASAVLAKADKTIPPRPDLIASHAMFVGRVISLESTTTDHTVESTFDTVFAGSTAVMAHNDMAGKQVAPNPVTGEFYHLNSAQATNVSNLGTMAAATAADYSTTAQANATYATIVSLNGHTSGTTSEHGGIVASTDPRLTDARVPTTHDNTKHSASYIIVSDVTDTNLSANTTDVTTGNASTSKHGLFPKLPTPSGQYLRDDLSWQTIAGGGDMLKSDNLSGLANYTTARSNLLGTTAGNAYDATIYSAPNGSNICYRLVNLLNGTVITDACTTTTLPRNTIFMGPQVQMSNGTANITVTTTAIGINKVYLEADM